MHKFAIKKIDRLLSLNGLDRNNVGTLHQHWAIISWTFRILVHAEDQYSYVYKMLSRFFPIALKQPEAGPRSMGTTAIVLNCFNRLISLYWVHGVSDDYCDIEVWPVEFYEILERLQSKFCKYILSINIYTCSDMMLEELDIMHLNIDISIYMVVYYAKLIW